jgi:hypothetical protein
LKNRQIPIFKGKPGQYNDAEYHGKDGLMDVIDHISALDISNFKVEVESAESAIVRIVNENPNEIELLGKLYFYSVIKYHTIRVISKLLKFYTPIWFHQV